MGALKERREKDMQTHNSEMKDLLRMISHDEKIKEFIQIKSNERGEYKQEKARRIQQRCRLLFCCTHSRIMSESEMYLFNPYKYVGK